MPIVFEPLPTQVIASQGDGFMALRGDARDQAMTASEQYGIIALFGDAESEFYGTADPLLPSLQDGTSLIYGQATSWVQEPGTQEGFIAFAGSGYSGFSETDSAQDGAMALYGDALQVAEPTSRSFIVMPAPVVRSFAGISFEALSDSFALSGGLDNRIIAVLREIALLAENPATSMDGKSRVSEDVRFTSGLAIVLRDLIAEGLVLAETATVNYLPISRVVDALLLRGTAKSHLEAVNTVIASIAFGSLVEIVTRERLEEGVTFNAAVTNALGAAVQMVETVLLHGEPIGHMTIGVLVNEGFTLGDATTSQLDAIAALREGIGFVLRMNLDDGQRIAWVVNPENKALTQYTNFPFNSFARVGGPDGVVYGMTPAGIRRLGGDADGTDAINGRFRLAVTNLGSSLAKRMQAAYLGYTSTGDLRLKAIVVGRDGRREAWTYRMLAQQGEEVQQARIGIGQGLKSVYWGFSLEAIDGAAFEIDLLALLPITLDHGMLDQGGGKR